MPCMNGSMCWVVIADIRLPYVASSRVLLMGNSRSCEITTGFNPASISRANSSSIVHAFSSTVSHNGHRHVEYLSRFVKKEYRPLVDGDFWSMRGIREGTGILLTCNDQWCWVCEDGLTRWCRMIGIGLKLRVRTGGQCNALLEQVRNFTQAFEFGLGGVQRLECWDQFPRCCLDCIFLQAVGLHHSVPLVPWNVKIRPLFPTILRFRIWKQRNYTSIILKRNGEKSNLIGEEHSVSCVVAHIVHTRIADEVHACVIRKLNSDFLEKKLIAVEVLDYKCPRSQCCIPSTSTGMTKNSFLHSTIVAFNSTKLDSSSFRPGNDCHNCSNSLLNLCLTSFTVCADERPTADLGEAPSG